MGERINRKDDETLYQPKIHSERIRELYVLKVATGLPMTVLVDLAIRELVEKCEANHGIIYDLNMKEREPQTEPIKQNCYYCGPGHPATWEVISDKGPEFVCGTHQFVLDEIHAIQKERQLGEAEWTINTHYGEALAEDEYDDTDEREDGSLYGF